jgi:hypothetical protein
MKIKIKYSRAKMEIEKISDIINRKRPEVEHKSKAITAANASLDGV